MSTRGPNVKMTGIARIVFRSTVIADYSRAAMIQTQNISGEEILKFIRAYEKK